MKFENWTPENDKFLKIKEIEIHNKYHEDIASSEITLATLFETPTRKFRIDALKEAISKVGAPIQGKVLEVGAGDGWCSAYLCRNYNIDEIFTMEINEAAIHKLIPKVFEVAKVDINKATLILGSFNDIRLKSHFDYVFVMGALHHSSNLYATFKNIYNCLKPGGWLIAQEPYMHNQALNNFYHKREGEEANFKGIAKITNSERTDLFYRECEYRVAGFHAGFDYQSQRVLKPAEKSQLKWYRKIIPENIDKPNNLIVFAQKPMNDQKPVTSWE